MLYCSEEEIKLLKIGIIGAGTMGTGISQVFVQTKGYEVLLCSSNKESAELGINKIEKNLKRSVDKGKIKAEEAAVAFAKIRAGILEECKDCDMIIESIPENLKSKQKLFKNIKEICRCDCIFATNTSSLLISEIGMDIKQPIIGMHFFNPAPVMRLIEVTPGANTPRKVVEKVMRIAVEIGKTPIEVKESRGFVVNKLLIPMINEAVGLYAEGVATVEDIDMAMQLGANHPVGPLRLGDSIGLDVCLAIMEELSEVNGILRYQPHPLLKKMVSDGRLGRKTGKGFYIYDD